MDKEYRSAKPEHYYGDTVRKLFLLAGVILLLAIVRDHEFLSLYISVGVFSVLVLTVLAGLTSPSVGNPYTRRIIVADVAISAVLFLLFEYLSIGEYARSKDIANEIFFLRQALALVFLIATYFSTKTFRGMFF